MKKFTLMMVAGLFALAGSVQAQVKCFYTDPVINFAAGATEADMVVSIDYEAGDEKVGCWQFEIVFPEGIAPIYDADEEEWLGEVSTDTNTKRLAKGGLNITKKADGNYLVLGFDTKGNQEMVSTHGTLCTIKISGSSEIQGTGKIVNSALSNLNDQSINKGNLADFEFGINQEVEGINDLQVAESNAPAYNLQGVRVNSAAKGLIIRDGKKMIVK